MNSKSIDNTLVRGVDGHLSVARRGREWLARLYLALAIGRERRRLRTLTDDALADIGLTRQQALLESRRGWLDLPAERVRAIE